MSPRFDKRKAFGQHFLKDQKVIETIVSAGVRALTENVDCSLFEIGPGMGALTNSLIERLSKEFAHPRKFFIAERDRLLIERWKDHAAVSKLLEGDVLIHSDEVFQALGSCVVVSNLPYSAGTAIVVRLVELRAQFPEMVLMFQAEVAKRLYAAPSTADRGSLSIYIQNFYEVSRLCVVPPGAFQPPPKVQSEVVILKRRATPIIHLPTAADEKEFEGLVKTGFAHRRKMLKGNFNGTRWQEPFLKSAVDPTKRAESLTFDEWKSIWDSRS
jgi:16S rRNA (adenine1518-N6/adenine1519-N6)-dimethyltransferase